jgi:hypothetical protein
MNKRALFAGLVYSLVAIIFKLTILLGGFTLTKFGFYYSNIVSVFLMIPFLFIAIYLVREKDRGGFITTKEAFRIALTVVALGALIISVYNYLAFNWKFKEIAEEYYNGKDFLARLTEQQIKNPDKLKVTDFPAIIKDQIAALSASKDVTAKLFPLVFIGLTGSFLTAIMMKKLQN